MTDFATRPATAEETETWLRLWRERLRRKYARIRSDPNTDPRVKRHTDSPDATVLRLLDGGEPVGFLALSTVSDFGATSAVLDDIYVDPAHRRRGLGSAAVRLAEDWARERSSRLRTRTDGESPEQAALVRGFTLGGQDMVKKLTDPPAGLDRFDIRPMTPAEFIPWRADSVAAYGQSFVDAGLLTPEEARVRAEEQTGQILPNGLDTPGHEILTILTGGEPAGVIWLAHGTEPDTSFIYDVEVHADQRGKGLGRALMLAGEAAALAAGSHRLGLHVFGHNSVAMRLYESLGYDIVDQNWSRTF